MTTLGTLASNPLCRDDLVVRSVGDDLIVMDPLTHEVHVLPSSYSAVLEACDGTTPARLLPQLLELAVAEVDEALIDLDRAGLLMAGYLAPKSMTRRGLLTR